MPAFCRVRHKPLYTRTPLGVISWPRCDHRTLMGNICNARRQTASPARRPWPVLPRHNGLVQQGMDLVTPRPQPNATPGARVHRQDRVPGGHPQGNAGRPVARVRLVVNLIQMHVFLPAAGARAARTPRGPRGPGASGRAGPIGGQLGPMPRRWVRRADPSPARLEPRAWGPGTDPGHNQPGTTGPPGWWQVGGWWARTPGTGQNPHRWWARRPHALTREPRTRGRRRRSASAPPDPHQSRTVPRWIDRSGAWIRRAASLRSVVTRGARRVTGRCTGVMPTPAQLRSTPARPSNISAPSIAEESLEHPCLWSGTTS